MLKINIPERLREARVKADLTQTEAAKLLYIHPSTLAKKERGSRSIYASELMDFAKLYRQPVAYFLGLL